MGSGQPGDDSSASPAQGGNVAHGEAPVCQLKRIGCKRDSHISQWSYGREGKN